MNQAKARERLLIEQNRALAEKATPELLGKITADAWETGDAPGAPAQRIRPLEGALKRGRITSEQYRAGQTYRQHWEYGGLENDNGLMALSLDRIGGGFSGSLAGMAKTEAQVHHRREIWAANAVVGPLGRQILELVVIGDTTVAKVGEMFGWANGPQAIAAGTVVLQRTLDDLCQHWQKKAPAETRAS